MKGHILKLLIRIQLWYIRRYIWEIVCTKYAHQVCTLIACLLLLFQLNQIITVSDCNILKITSCNYIGQLFVFFFAVAILCKKTNCYFPLLRAPYMEGRPWTLWYMQAARTLPQLSLTFELYLLGGGALSCKGQRLLVKGKYIVRAKGRNRSTVTFMFILRGLWCTLIYSFI